MILQLPLIVLQGLALLIYFSLGMLPEWIHAFVAANLEEVRS